jgi:hypothetical protein
MPPVHKKNLRHLVQQLMVHTALFAGFYCRDIDKGAMNFSAILAML